MAPGHACPAGQGPEHEGLLCPPISSSFPNNPGYQVSKAGLESMARSIAYDLGSKNIRANSLVLGYIKTDMTSKSYNDKKLREERTNR